MKQTTINTEITRVFFTSVCRALILSLILSATADVSAAPTDKPNVILIIADDLSWGDLGCYGQQKILTPNLDRMAKQGMRFTNAYAGNSVCRAVPVLSDAGALSGARACSRQLIQVLS